MKKILTLFLVLILAMIAPLAVSAAEFCDITLDYSLTCNGENMVTVPSGTTINVDYSVENITTDDSFSVYAIQNEIYFDHNFFEFVEDSFELKIPSVITNIMKDMDENRRPIYEIFFNDFKTIEYENNQLVGSFKLKVIAESGISTLKSTNIMAYADGEKLYRVSDTLSNLTVTVGSGDEKPETAQIKYVSDGKTTTLTHVIGQKISIAGAPDNVPDGKVFDYWKSTDGTQYKPGDKYVVNGNETFTAVWKDNVPPESVKYTLTFETNGGSEIEPITKTVDAVISLSAYKPTRSNYDFKGWYEDEALTKKISSVTFDADKTVYAKWERKSSGGTGGAVVSKYTLSFETNGGSEIKSVSKVKNTTIDLSKYVSSKEGFVFDGWYSDKELTKKVPEITLNKDTTVYAKWVVSEDKPIVEKPNYKPGILTDEHYAYIVGREGGMIAPESDITRAEVATIIYRLLDEDERNKAKTKENVFTDVNEDDWFNTAVSTLASLELVKGRTTDTFAPNAFITRAELATIFARMVEVEYDGKVLFSDVSGHWAESYINEAATAEWIVGYNGLFRPDDNITRAEVMTLVNRVLNREPESKADLLDGMTTWKDNANENAWYYLAVQEATNSHTYEMKADGKHEKWTTLTENPNWAEFE